MPEVEELQILCQTISTHSANIGLNCFQTCCEGEALYADRAGDLQVGGSIKNQRGCNGLLPTLFALEDLMKMSIVDMIDLLYSIYAIGVFVFIAYFAHKLTTPRSK